MEEFVRLTNLIGKDNFDKLAKSRVIVFGIGGVGGYVVECLARCGVGNIDIVDFDNVSVSNLNRQIIALGSTVNKSKVNVMKDRISEINNYAKVNAINTKVDANTISNFDFSKYDYCIDAIDMTSSKLLIIESANKCNVPVISCMGTGNKTDSSKLKIDKIEKTSYCPLAKVMRKELKDRNIKNVDVLYSTEEVKVRSNETISSIMYVPAIAGLKIAEFVIKKLMEK